MDDRRQTGTNAADSAPGTDDGAAMGAKPQHFTKPGPRSRGGVWLWVALSVAILVAVFIARPRQEFSDEGPATTAATTQGEIENSTVPGASDPSRPADQRR
jgi:hypothetical protein